MLEDYMNKGIKDVISEFPEVADILEQYNIGCVPCTVGTCLLKDIVEIHNLPEEDEQALMAGIAAVIEPGRQATLPPVKTKRQTKPGTIRYSPPLRKLVEEHILIKRLVGSIPWIVENLEIETEEGRRLVLRTTEFIRFYADKYHHAKEEEILFKYFDMDSDILKAMRQEHEQARSHVRAILDALERTDKDTIAEHLNAYCELLAEHIRKEDEILYPWMDRGLTVTQVGEMFSAFAEVEAKTDKNVIDDSRRFVIELEEKMLRLTKEVTK